MDVKERKISRGCHDDKFYLCYFYRLISPFLGKYLLSLLPAFSYGCTKTADPPKPFMDDIHTKISVPAPSMEINTLDVFVFKDDRFSKLDCYQRFDNMGDWQDAVVSSGGERIITALANTPYAREDWLKVSSRSYLKDIMINLEDETREFPVMTGELSIDTYNKNSLPRTLSLIPLASEIRLNTICCDFSGKAYAGEKITDAKVYLTNVNAECGILEERETYPKRIINTGRLREEDMEKFTNPDLIMQEIPKGIGSQTSYVAISLWCYQNCHQKESPGSPYTRLVIEGKISGQTYYWPIDINREAEEEAGIWRGKCYSFNIKITTKGASDPDIPVKTDEIIINQEVAKWKEIQEYEVSF